MLTPPEAFDERKLPRTTVSLLRTTGTSIGSVLYSSVPSVS